MTDNDSAHLGQEALKDPVAVTNGTKTEAGAGWRKAKAVMANVQVSQAFNTLRDMTADVYIDPSCLKAIKVLGEGAYATVQQAWYTPKGSSSRKMVAVKYLRGELFKNAEDLQLFRQEIELMRKLRQRNIVEFIGAGELSGPSPSEYVVQEYMAGGTMKQLVVQQMMSAPGRIYNDADSLDMCLQIARGLKYLHNCRPMVLHRDLKLENVLLKGPNSPGHHAVKLADFGLSKTVAVKQAAIINRRHSAAALHQLDSGGMDSSELESLWSERIRSQTSLARAPSGMHRAKSKELLTAHTEGTQTFNLTGRTGSLMYMAPEVFHEQPYNEKADVFSFAIMMYEILQQYIMLMAVSVRGTYEELEAYAARVAGGYRPPVLEKWPAEVSSVIKVGTLAAS
eukprot:GHUV01024165.1.p1 GENE.GHUV01024165.1~~GHUV01024165.1.p1  ORF type:complete len:396 (+),score=103.79 GHUV01024165.1:320-1507(+)